MSVAVERANRWSRRRWLGLGCAQCACWMGLPAAATEFGIDTDPEAYELPPRLERPDPASDEGGLWAMMDREETRLRRGPFVIRDTALQAYLQQIACKLGGEHCKDTRPQVVRTPLFNATMAPNGMMQVWSGLLLRVDNEAQLAAVLGHELAHYLRRHSLERLRDLRSRSAFMTLLTPFGLVGALAQLAAVGALLAYNRDHEREADRIGLVLMRRAGYDTRQAGAVWRNLRSELAAGAGGDPANKSVLFATHPGIDERQQVLDTLAGEGGGIVAEAEYHGVLEGLMPQLLDDELKRAQYDESIVLLQRLCVGRPRHGLLRYSLGEARRRRAKDDDLALAVADFNAALVLDKPPPAAHRALGLVARLQGRHDDAKTSFWRYLQAAPDASDAELVRAYLDESPS